MEVASFIATGIVIVCISVAMTLCVFAALGNVDTLVKNADEWEDGE
jgi:hypothetical protein